ncbi:Maf family protein [Sulfobacillus harzensis]|uniref:dTTP/UTP pyrophosphatase n=1 Tax=Sulfobacillus harzensis TaxID=2729629 RepID=A0A7Y0L1E7_9FIRM|nr:Maf family protein [Sulfobacillus harzensis]NMP21247.1 septum formation protein Maf [Sulfobacillus harzensis]
MNSLILASSSPRRHHLLSQMGLSFEVVPADLDETARPHERPESLVRRLAASKALAVGEKRPEALVLGADTVVALGAQILGKPRDASDAERMLQMLSGTRHEICTGVSVWSGVRGLGYVAVSVAHVTFRPLSPVEIQTYVATGEPMDKAGAYAIQGGAGRWVESYEGNLETVIGLPRDVVERLLKRMAGEKAWGSEKHPGTKGRGSGS